MFQILTQKGWIEVMNDTMFKTGKEIAAIVAIYFISYHLIVTLVSRLCDGVPGHQVASPISYFTGQICTSDLYTFIPLHGDLIVWLVALKILCTFHTIN